MHVASLLVFYVKLQATGEILHCILNYTSKYVQHVYKKISLILVDLFLKMSAETTKRYFRYLSPNEFLIIALYTRDVLFLRIFFYSSVSMQEFNAHFC